MVKVFGNMQSHNNLHVILTTVGAGKSIENP